MCLFMLQKIPLYFKLQAVGDNNKQRFTYTSPCFHLHSQNQDTVNAIYGYPQSEKKRKGGKKKKHKEEAASPSSDSSSQSSESTFLHTKQSHLEQSDSVSNSTFHFQKTHTNSSSGKQHSCAEL